ncbi:3-keto-disaccharide hydrolase [Polaribacter sp.]|uniref:3-keto-disaccharide hydrolase n=1 Tax=Polaribacter sp. TaxID=1920175 RepID=UPI003EF305E1
MKFSTKHKMFFVFFFCWMLPQTICSQHINEAIEPEVKGEKVIDLLDGGSLNMWKNSSNSWSLQNGMIVGNTKNEKLDKPEWIYTKEQFNDFEFTCEVKLTGDNQRNTGIYFRVNTFLFKQKRGNNSYEAASGYEYDIASHKPGKKDFRGSLGDWYARLSLRVFADEKIMNQMYKPKDWNRITIRARRNRIEYWINGVKIIDFFDKDPNASQKGCIGFQIHNGSVMKVEYREIRVNKLDFKRN